MLAKDYIFIDFDGVILDSEERMLYYKDLLGYHNHRLESEFDAFFEYTNTHPDIWDSIIKEASSINDSVNIIKELEYRKKRIAILTKIHTLYEMKVKIDTIRQKHEIMCPIIFVPPGAKKHQVVIPNNQLLIDDYDKNIQSWILNGGRGMLFDRNLEHNQDNMVRSLEFLLKR